MNQEQSKSNNSSADDESKQILQDIQDYLTDNPILKTQLTFNEIISQSDKIENQFQQQCQLILEQLQNINIKRYTQEKQYGEKILLYFNHINNIFLEQFVDQTYLDNLLQFLKLDQSPDLLTQIQYLMAQFAGICQVFQQNDTQILCLMINLMIQTEEYQKLYLYMNNIDQLYIKSDNLYDILQLIQNTDKQQEQTVFQNIHQISKHYCQFYKQLIKNNNELPIRKWNVCLSCVTIAQISQKISLNLELFQELEFLFPGLNQILKCQYSQEIINQYQLWNKNYQICYNIIKKQQFPKNILQIACFNISYLFKYIQMEITKLLQTLFQEKQQDKILQIKTDLLNNMQDFQQSESNNLTSRTQISQLINQYCYNLLLFIENQYIKYSEYDLPISQFTGFTYPFQGISDLYVINLLYEKIVSNSSTYIKEIYWKIIYILISIIIVRSDQTHNSITKQLVQQQYKITDEQNYVFIAPFLDFLSQLNENKQNYIIKIQNNMQKQIYKVLNQQYLNSIQNTLNLIPKYIFIGQSIINDFNEKETIQLCKQLNVKLISQKNILKTIKTDEFQNYKQKVKQLMNKPYKILIIGNKQAGKSSLISLCTQLPQYMFSYGFQVNKTQNIYPDVIKYVNGLPTNPIQKTFQKLCGKQQLEVETDNFVNNSFISIDSNTYQSLYDMSEIQITEEQNQRKQIQNNNTNILFKSFKTINDELKQPIFKSLEREQDSVYGDLLFQINEQYKDKKQNQHQKQQKNNFIQIQFNKLVPRNNNLNNNIQLVIPLLYQPYIIFQENDTWQKKDQAQLNIQQKELDQYKQQSQNLNKIIQQEKQQILYYLKQFLQMCQQCVFPSLILDIIKQCKFIESLNQQQIQFTNKQVINLNNQIQSLIQNLIENNQQKSNITIYQQINILSNKIQQHIYQYEKKQFELNENNYNLQVIQSYINQLCKLKSNYYNNLSQFNLLIFTVSIIDINTEFYETLQEILNINPNILLVVNKLDLTERINWKTVEKLMQNCEQLNIKPPILLSCKTGERLQVLISSITKEILNYLNINQLSINI